MLAYTLGSYQVHVNLLRGNFKFHYFFGRGGWVELQPHILEPQPHIGWVGGELKNKAKLSQVLLNLSLG